ncbi:hypothetical protein PILCRDRAFT_632 [Piloderma croceum F 1598]|uniref:Aminoglycoside phosphotransferase domain-containing protein n=1 Tax=Piloderma croceum (strain F 1598) TaxID=765440 RepID=A0A0C3CNX6_PILCF|nr:hypothetical protein PILCRDRAFT_632 [Piloderma croceum F 1598]
MSDEHRHVLVLEDLGEDLITVDEWLCPPSDVGPAVETCKSAGARVGFMLAASHSDAALHERLGLKEFVNPDAIDLWANGLVGKIKEILCLHGKNGPQKTMFSNGDLWTGSILISSAEEDEIGLIDWEFAGEERVFQDLCQLSARLHLFAHIDGWSFNKDKPSSSSRRRMDALGIRNLGFLRKRFTAYAQERNRLQVIRSTWILHGRELIFDVTLPEVTHKFERILRNDVEGWKKVVELGWRYVRVAAETADMEFKAAL